MDVPLRLDDAAASAHSSTGSSTAEGGINLTGTGAAFTLRTRSCGVETRIDRFRRGQELLPSGGRLRAIPGNAQAVAPLSWALVRRCLVLVAIPMKR
jgi:hypothetical protein